MHVQRLDHVNIQTHDLATTEAFYVNVLGLRVGERPPFGFAGLWLYDDAVPVIHLTGLLATDVRVHGSGSIDHIAFRASGLASLRERIGMLRIEAQERIVPRNGDLQIFLTDPNGVKIELTFAAAEAALQTELAQH